MMHRSGEFLWKEYNVNSVSEIAEFNVFGILHLFVIQNTLIYFMLIYIFLWHISCL
jgi:hypothetical protein